MTRFTDYVDAQSGGGVLDWRHDLIDPDGNLLATTDEDSVDDGVIEWGASIRPLAFEGSRISQRSGSMFVPIADSSLLPSGKGGLLHPEAANRVRSHAGIVKADGTTAWWAQSTMMIDDTVGTFESGAVGATLALTDSLRPVLSDLTTTFQHDRDETVEAVVRRLAQEVIPAASIAQTGFTMPGGSLPAGSDRFEAIDLMLEGCGHELVCDGLGRVYSRPILPSTLNDQAERWIYGTDGIPVQRAERRWTIRAPQGARVEGGSLRTASASATLIVWDQDPTSEGYFDGPGEVSLLPANYPYAEETPQLAVAGYGQLRRHGVGPATVDFETIPNPAIQEGDLVTLGLPELGLDGEFRVMSYRLPIEVDGLMVVTARAVFDPALGYDGPAAPGSSCLVSIDDSFDRPDENLENVDDPIGSSPGSPDWTEHGFSWGVVNQNAIQRFDGGWSLAYVNTPLCSTDQIVTVEIERVPSGRRIGPVVRTSGAFEGYAALVDPNGQVRIEMWLNGQSQEVLASSGNTGSPAGKTLSIAIVGLEIVARLNGDVVAQATDGRLTGSHVGMLALGGSPSNAPAVRSFQAEQAT